MQEVEQLKTELRTRDSSLKMLGVCPLCCVCDASWFLQLLCGALHCCVPSMTEHLPVRTHYWQG